MIDKSATTCLRISLDILIVIVLIIGFGKDVSGVTIVTFDDDTPPSRMKEIVNENVDLLTDSVKFKLRTGNLKNISYLCRELLKANAGNDDIRAILCIALASGREFEKAKAELSNVKRRHNNLFALTAQAMISLGETKYKQALAECAKAININPSHPFPRNVMGQIHSKLENHEKAIKSFKKAIQLEPKFLSAYTNLGAAACKLGDEDLALKYFQQSVARNPKAHGAFWGMGLIYEKRGQTILAIKAFQENFKLNPQNNVALAKIGNLQLNAGQYDSARTTATEMKIRGIETAHLILGHVALHKGEVEQAVSFLEMLPKQNPDAQYLLGIADIITGKYQPALTRMENILKAAPLHYGAYTTRAILKFNLDHELDPTIDLKNHWNKSLGKYLDYISGAIAAANHNFKFAEQSWQSSSGLVPEFSLTGIDIEHVFNNVTSKQIKHQVLGLLFHFKNFNDHAISEFEKSMAIGNNPILSCYWAAKACLQKKDLKQAEFYLEQALTNAPEFHSALNMLGDLQLKTAKPMAAVETLHKSYTIKKDPSLLLKLGSELGKIGLYKKAEEQYRLYIKDFPGIFIGYNQLAWLFAKQGNNLNEAMELANNANVLQPGNPLVLDTIGWIYYQKEDFDTAFDYLTMAYEKANGIPSILYHLAAVYYEKNQKELAAEYLTRALNISNSFGEADEARRLLKQIG